MLSSFHFPTPFGNLEVAASDIGINRIRFTSVPEYTKSGTSENMLKEARAQLLAYFAGRIRDFNLPLDLSGQGTFAAQVLETTRTIAYGETWTYGQLAGNLGRPGAARAVGAALAANPILVLIPCHRVIAANGHLTGYAAGMAVKIQLLKLEGHEIVGEKLV